MKDVKVDTIHNVQGNEQFSKIRLPLTATFYVISCLLLKLRARKNLMRARSKMDKYH